jgi:probable HAF family extracellular repeat protein
MKRVLAMMAMTGALSAGPVYEITDLGTIGGSASAAFAVNQHGVAVGGATDIFGNQWAVTSSGSSWSNFAIDATADDVNGTGTIAGTTWVNAKAFATVWQGGSPRFVGGADSYAMGINEAGQVTGMANGHLFVTTPDGQLIDLGLPAGASQAAGYDINLAGQVAGYSMMGSFFRAFTATQGGGFQSLGTLGGANSYAMAINDAGTVAGHGQTSSGYLHAAIWAGGGIVDLGTLGEGNSYAYGINNENHVVGYTHVRGEAHAFLYRDGFMIDLNNVIDSASGWLLTAAYGINDAGQVVGTGTFGGVEHAFRLEVAAAGSPVIAIFNDSPIAESSAAVPEPGTWAMALTGVALCAVGVWRRPTSNLN